jgi:uncharacterized protein (TIGR00730 family)
MVKYAIAGLRFGSEVHHRHGEAVKRICVNCGSSPGFGRQYLEAARRLGSALARRNLGLVYGGAEVGLMGEVANSVLESGGTVIGVIPESFAGRVSHRGLTELRIVGSMHERKQTMADLSDGFIALPGGYGTLEEITELLTWAQLGFHQKPCGLMNVGGYYDRFLSFLDHAVREGFIRQRHREMLLVSTEPEELLERFMSYQPSTADKWSTPQ